MPDDPVYRQLQEDLDRMPVGFPPTPSGVEIRILQQLFTPLEARVALCLSLLPEPVATVHYRFGSELTRDELACVLEQMEYRGLIRRDGDRYGKLPFVIGIYEGQVDRMTPQLARDLLAYFEEGLVQAVRPRKTTQLRTVPVNQAIPVERAIAQYDNIRESVRRAEGPFGVMNCICRQAKDLAGEPCLQTAVRENCLTMGSPAQVMLDHERARPITREDMLQLLEEADREGLVLQPQNTSNPLFICCCCGCCCVALRAGKQHDRPAEFFNSNYFAELEGGVCESCGVCVARCQMEAVSMPDTAAVDLARCIGCGLCVSTCPSGAMRLMPKTEADVPPRSTEALYARIYRERYGTAALALAAVKFATRTRV